MENASKALIIAGAILLAILLISLGILIFRQAQGAINGSGMSDAELTTFNYKFTKYEGTQTGSTIRAMVQEVMTNNNNAEASDQTRVAITNNAGTKGVTLDKAKGAQPVYGADFRNTSRYTVTITYTDGRVTTINVK